MRSYVTRILLAFGVWFGGAGAHLQATERAPVDIYDYAGRFRLGEDGLVTFHVTCGELYMTSIVEGMHPLTPAGENRFSAANGTLVVTFHSLQLVEIAMSDGPYEAMGVRMADGERVPIEYILDGDFDEAIRAYLVMYENDMDRIQLRSRSIERAARELRAEGEVDQSIMLLGMLSVVYPNEAITFRGLGDVYLALAIENYREYSRLSGQIDNVTPALEFVLEQNE